MRLGQGRSKIVARFGKNGIAFAARGKNAVAQQRFAGAIILPHAVMARLVEKVEQRLIVIAAQVPSCKSVPGPREKTIDHAFGVRTSIDVVPKIDDDSFARGALAVANDLLLYSIEQIEPPVDVPDGVDPRTRGNRGYVALSGKD